MFSLAIHYLLQLSYFILVWNVKICEGATPETRLQYIRVVVLIFIFIIALIVIYSLITLFDSTSYLSLQTVQSQQRAEREAAITRLEQSRIILAMRLADHQGKKYKVIEEALAFVGNVRNAGNFVSPEDLYEIQRTQPGENEENHKGQNLSVLMRMLFSGLALARSSFRIERIGGVLGNAAVFAVSMLALLQLQQVAFRSDPSTAKAESFYRKRDNKNNTHLASSPQSSEVKHLDVLLARG